VWSGHVTVVPAVSVLGVSVHCGLIVEHLLARVAMDTDPPGTGDDVEVDYVTLQCRQAAASVVDNLLRISRPIYSTDI